jgi:uncharacterized delta-60 repeat protein
MAKTLQFRRGTTGELELITGAPGELFVDTTKDVVVVSDGVTVGGFPLQSELVSNVNIKTINGNSILGAGDIVITGGDYGNANVAANLAAFGSNPITTTGNITGSFFIGNGSQLTGVTASADFSEIAEDVLPAFSEVYDIGSADKRWYDGYYSNKVDIDGAEIRGSVDGVVIDSALLVDQLLVSDNIITPDDSSVRQYFGEKGVVVINGNLDVDGEYLGTPVVETTSVPSVPGGAIDTTFTAGGNSGQSFDGQVDVIKIQADGNILVGGRFENYSGVNQNYFTALSTDGDLVPTIANNILNTGGVNNSVFAIAIQEDNKILVGGAFTTIEGASAGRIARLDTSGLNDFGFSTGSGFNSTVRAIDVQSDGKILVGGDFSSYNSTGANALIRLNTDGSRDNGYSTLFPGSAIVEALAIQSDGKILAGGDFSSYDGSSRSRLVRINSNGSLDSSFDIGSGFNDYVYAIAIQEDNKILVGGAFTTFNGDTQNRLVRLNSDGSLDSSFDTGVGLGDGADTTQVVDITVQSDGKILVVGDFGTYNGTTARSIVRLEADGTIDSTWITEGFSFVGEARSADSIGIRENGNIIVGGRFTSYDGTNSSYIVEIIGGSDEIPGPAIPTGGAEGFIRYNADLSTFQAYTGTSWKLLERVTTPPTSLETTGTIDIDFSGALLQTQGALTGNITYTGSNYTAGSSVTIRVVGGESSQSVAFPAEWVFVGATPTSLDIGLTAILIVTSFGTTEADCVATWAVSE